MKQIDSVMCYILVGAWLALSAILMLNLLIALLTDTFHRYNFIAYPTSGPAKIYHSFLE